MTALDNALDAVMQLSSEQKQMLIEIVWRRQIEERRKEIAERAREAISAFHAGALKPVPVEDLLEWLHASLDRSDDE